jgi:transposase InsO family protein
VVELIELSGITQSMSRRGDCYDNAVAESFFASYKLECVPKEGFTTQQQAKDETSEWIEIPAAIANVYIQRWVTSLRSKLRPESV